MAIQLLLATSTDTLVDLQSAGYVVLDDFYPAPPADDISEVADRIRMELRDTAGLTVDQKITAINQAFNLARIHHDDAGAVYISYAKNSTDTTQRSLVSDGSVVIEKRMRRDNKAIVNVYVQRAPWWEGQYTQIPLTNANGTDNTSGLTVWNHDDAGAGHDNYVQIAAASVLGDLPAATRLELTNNYNSAVRLYDIWIGQNWTDPASLSHILEGEVSTGGATASAADCSGGYYTRAVCASASTEQDLLTWTLATAFLSACKGGFFKLLARFVSSAPTDIRFRAVLKYQSTTIWQSGQISLDASVAKIIRDLFTLRLPPWLPGQSDLSGLTLTLTGQQSTGSPINVDIDFIQATPVDGWRYLTCIGYGVAYTERVVDDGLARSLFADDTNQVNKAGILVGYGSPILLQPNKLQRLYFLMHTVNANTAEIARTMSVKLYYRPRRRTI